MNWDQVEGNWKIFKGKIKEKWGKLTDDELDQINGQRDKLIGHIQKQYGVAREAAEREVSEWWSTQSTQPEDEVLGGRFKRP